MTKSHTVLVTGANGFIGTRVVWYLAQMGFEVHGLSRKLLEPEIEGVTFHDCDLFDYARVTELCRNIQAESLVHLAWDVSDNYRDAVSNIEWVSSSLHLIESFATAGGTNICAAGTCLEYDESSKVLTEDLSPLGPSTIYGAAKHLLHRTVVTQFPDISFAWARIFYLYGPNENPGRLVSAVARGLTRGETVKCSHGRQVLDYLHVDDVATALCTVLRSDYTGPINIGSGIPITVRELVTRLASIANGLHTVQFDQVPKDSEYPTVIVADNRKLLNLGWKPRFDHNRGLQQIYEWWSETGVN